MKELYTRREAIAAALFGAAVAGMIWGPAILRPFRSSHAVDLATLHLPDDRPVAHARSSPTAIRGAKAKPVGPVDINHADSAALQGLPGIGPTLARRIVTHRSAHGPFADTRGLLEVDGIGPKRLEKIASWITAR